mgnify:CR=1 FL=1
MKMFCATWEHTVTTKQDDIWSNKDILMLILQNKNLDHLKYVIAVC